MKLQDIRFGEELREEDELEICGGFSAIVRSENTNLSTASCIDAASLAFIQSGLNPSVNNNNLVVDFIGNNVVIGRCDGANNVFVVFAAGVDPTATQNSRATRVINNYP